jgi:hypothetical protein
VCQKAVVNPVSGEPDHLLDIAHGDDIPGGESLANG